MVWRGGGTVGSRIGVHIPPRGINSMADTPVAGHVGPVAGRSGCRAVSRRGLGRGRRCAVRAGATTRMALPVGVAMISTASRVGLTGVRGGGAPCASGISSRAKRSPPTRPRDTGGVRGVAMLPDGKHFVAACFTRRGPPDRDRRRANRSAGRIPGPPRRRHGPWPCRPTASGLPRAAGQDCPALGRGDGQEARGAPAATTASRPRRRLLARRQAADHRPARTRPWPRLGCRVGKETERVDGHERDRHLRPPSRRPVRPDFAATTRPCESLEGPQMIRPSRS